MAGHRPRDPSSIRIEPPVTYTSIALSRGVLPNLPYSQHPIYFIRKITVMSAFASFILYLPSSNSYYDSGLLTFTIFSLLASVLLCVADLYTWAHKKASNPDEDPAWPARRIMLGDLIMAVALLSIFVGAFSEASWRRNYLDGTVAMLRDYSFLATLICSGLHAYAFWKQLMALYERSWLAALQLPLHDSCQRCGYAPPPPLQRMPYQDAPRPQADVYVSAPLPQHRAPQNTHRQEPQQQWQQRYRPVHPQHMHQPPPTEPPNLHTYIGPSATLTPGSHASPSSYDSSVPVTEGHLDDGLLIGPGYEGSGSVCEATSAAPQVNPRRGKPAEVEFESEEPILEEPAEVVVGKKGTKRRER